MEPGQRERTRTAWKRRGPRNEPQSARGNQPSLQPENLLTERRTEDGHLMGPYETTYDLTSGYGLDRVIINP
jgi:hypothetical protein